MSFKPGKGNYAPLDKAEVKWVLECYYRDHPEKLAASVGAGEDDRRQDESDENPGGEHGGEGDDHGS